MKVTSYTNEFLGTTTCPNCGWSNFFSHWKDDKGNDIIIQERPAPEGCPSCGYFVKMYTTENRKPLEFLAGGDTWVRDESERVVGTFIQADAREPWRTATFRPKAQANLTDLQIIEICKQLNAHQGMEIRM